MSTENSLHNLSSLLLHYLHYYFYSDCYLLLLLYAVDVLQLVKSHQLSSHAYADTQIYGFCQPSDIDALQESMSVCIDDMISWVLATRIQVNPAKTEVLWYSSAHRQHQNPSDPVHVGTRSTVPICVGNTSVLPVSVVRDLGVYLDADPSMRAHITATIRTCFAIL